MAQIVRIMIIKDLAPHGIVLNPSEVLANVEIDGLRNTDHLRQYRVLYNRYLNLGSAAIETTSVGEIHKYVKYYRRFNLTTFFNSGNAGSIADIEENSLYLLVVG